MYLLHGLYGEKNPGESSTFVRGETENMQCCQSNVMGEKHHRPVSQSAPELDDDRVFAPLVQQKERENCWKR